MKTNYTGLVGDVGGTNARLALVDEAGHIRHPKTYPAADFGALGEVIGQYLETTVGRRCPPRAVLAPVKAPRSWPKSSDSRTSCDSAAQLTVTNGFAARFPL